MERIGKNKILTREGIIEIINDKYIRFQLHDHIRGHKTENLMESIEAAEILCEGRKLPFLTISKQFDRLDKKEEDIARASLKKLFTAQAMVTNSKITIMIVKLALSIKKADIPTKIFANEENAIKWLLNQ